MTEQVTLPDFFHNTHAIYHMMVDYAPVYQDLDFAEYDLAVPLGRHCSGTGTIALPTRGY